MSNIAFVNTPSARFAVIGDPVSHSLSPLLHKTAFEIMGSGAVYTQLRVEAKDLERFARLMRGTAAPIRYCFGGGVDPAMLLGVNVTIPHKQRIIPFLDEVTGDAEIAGAVNTVVASPDFRRYGGGGEDIGAAGAAGGVGVGGGGTVGAAGGGRAAGDAGRGRAAGENKVKVREYRLVGHNTDMAGLLMAIRGCGYDYRDSAVAILGTGGAALGILCKAVREGARQVQIFGRSAEKGRAFAARAAELADRGADGRADGRADEGLDGFAEGRADGFAAAKAAPAVFRNRLPEAADLETTDIFINATPLGMTGWPDDFEDTDFLGGLPPGALVYDIVYTPAETKLVRAARARGLYAENGLGMLVWQGLLSDELFLSKNREDVRSGELYKAVYAVLSGELRKREEG